MMQYIAKYRYLLILIVLVLVGCGSTGNRDAIAYYERGVEHNDQHEWALAVEQFDQAIALNPEYIEAFFQRALAHVFMLNNDLAIADYTKIIEIDPENVAAYKRRAATYSMQMDDELIPFAIEDYRMVISLDPTDSDAYSGRSFLYIRSEKTYLALEDMNKAIEFLPDNADNFELSVLFHARSRIYEQLGEYENALADLDQVIELDSELGKTLEDERQNLIELLAEQE